MSDQFQHPSKRKRIGWWIVVVLMLLPLVYVLSPPIVMWVVGDMFFRDIYWIYTPMDKLYWGSDHFRGIFDLYLSCYSDDCLRTWLRESYWYSPENLWHINTPAGS